MEQNVFLLEILRAPNKEGKRRYIRILRENVVIIIWSVTFARIIDVHVRL